MMIALDAYVRNYTEFIKKQLPPGIMQMQMDWNERLLQQIMVKNNKTDLVDLFQEVAVRLEG